jgi:hypothetical protein
MGIAFYSSLKYFLWATNKKEGWASYYIRFFNVRVLLHADIKKSNII